MTVESAVPPATIPSGEWRVVTEASTAAFTVRDKLVSTVHGTLPIRSGNATLASAGLLAQASVELDATATLSARGAQCPLTLQASPLSEEGGGIRVQVHGRLDRKSLGMSVPSFIIGRYLDLDVDLLLTADS